MRSAGTRSHALLYGDGGGEVVNFVDVRLFKSASKLADIRAQALHVPTLPFGVECVKGQRAFSGTTQTGDHSEGPQWKVYIDPLEIVHTGSANPNEPRR